MQRLVIPAFPKAGLVAELVAEPAVLAEPGWIAIGIVLISLAGDWAVELPIGDWLRFVKGDEVYGLWIGLTLAPILMLVFVLWRRAQEASTLRQAALPAHHATALP